MIPETIGGYRVLAPLGRSTQGDVYHAVSELSGTPVTLRVILKEIFRNEEARIQFISDARAVQEIEHPHLRRLREVGETDQVVYLSMEYLEGSSLESLLVAGPVEIVAALGWAAEGAEALAALHRRNLVHGHLRPEKVFITAEGHAKLLDGGLWRLLLRTDADLTDEEVLRESGLTPVAVACLAPEQIQGKPPKPQSDIHSLGLVLYEMLTARNPFLSRGVVQSMHWVLKRIPPPPSQLRREVPRRVDAVLAAALAKEPKERFSSTTELAGILRALVEEPEVKVEPTVAAPVSSRTAWLGLTAPLWLALGGAVVLLLLWFLYLYLTH